MASTINQTHIRNVFSVVRTNVVRKLSVSYFFRKRRHQSKCDGSALLPRGSFLYATIYSHTWGETSLLTPKVERNSFSTDSSFLFSTAWLIATWFGIWWIISQPSQRKADGDKIIVTKWDDDWQKTWVLIHEFIDKHDRGTYLRVRPWISWIHRSPVKTVKTVKTRWKPWKYGENRENGENCTHTRERNELRGDYSAVFFHACENYAQRRRYIKYVHNKKKQVPNSELAFFAWQKR